jgi:outer membrane protein OmpA-like peptidoglycan-associated protein
MWPSRKLISLAIAFGTIAGCAANNSPLAEGPAYQVFFEEFSADISPEARTIIDSAAIEAKRRHTTVIRVEARGNANGSSDATMKIAETRAAVVRDALLSDGIANSSILLVPLGQLGTTDTGVMPRRVTITLEN